MRGSRFIWTSGCSSISSYSFAQASEQASEVRHTFAQFTYFGAYVAQFGSDVVEFGSDVTQFHPDVAQFRPEPALPGNDHAGERDPCAENGE